MSAHPRLDLFADLQLEVDGSPVTVTADGAEVLVSLTAPAEVLDAVVGLPRPVGLDRRGVRHALARWADGLAGQGLDVVVAGPSGVLLTAGAHAAPSRLLRLVTGTDRLGLGPWASLRRPLGTVARRRLGTVARRRLAAVVHRRS